MLSIVQPSPFSSEWVSYKFNGLELSCKVEISVYGGHVALINGPLRPEDLNDTQIFCQNLHKELGENEFF